MSEQSGPPAGFAPPNGTVPWSCAWSECRGQEFWIGMEDDGLWLQCVSCKRMLPLEGLDSTRWLDRTAWREGER